MAGDSDKRQDKDNEAQKEYDKLRSKYALPEYKELDREFGIGNLEPSNFVLRSVILKFAERCDYTAKILADLIQPENHLADMQEAEHISDSEKKKVNELFKRLSFYEKEFLIVEFDYSDDDAAALIKKFINDWMQMKPDFLRILAAVRGAWKEKEHSDNQGYSYFG
jgi:hypothetical protein